MHCIKPLVSLTISGLTLSNSLSTLSTRSFRSFSEIAAAALYPLVQARNPGTAESRLTLLLEVKYVRLGATRGRVAVSCERERTRRARDTPRAATRGTEAILILSTQEQNCEQSAEITCLMQWCTWQRALKHVTSRPFGVARKKPLALGSSFSVTNFYIISFIMSSGNLWGDNDVFDSALMGILQQCGKIQPFLEVLFSFLSRRTDFYIIMESETAKMGFPNGVALNMVMQVSKQKRRW